MDKEPTPAPNSEELQEAINSLKSAQELAQEIESVKQSVSKGTLKDLPKDIVRVQGYVIDIQKRAIDTLLRALESRDSIQEQLAKYIEDMTMITTSYRTAIESVEKPYKDKIASLMADIETADVVIREQKETIVLLTNRVKMLSGGGV